MILLSDLFDFFILGSYDVEEVGGFDNYLSEIGLAEEIALRIAKNVTQPVVIAGFQHHMSKLGT